MSEPKTRFKWQDDAVTKDVIAEIILSSSKGQNIGQLVKGLCDHIESNALRAALSSSEPPPATERRGRMIGGPLDGQYWDDLEPEVNVWGYRRHRDGHRHFHEKTKMGFDYPSSEPPASGPATDLVARITQLSGNVFNAVRELRVLAHANERWAQKKGTWTVIDETNLKRYDVELCEAMEELCSLAALSSAPRETTACDHLWIAGPAPIKAFECTKCHTIKEEA